MIVPGVVGEGLGNDEHGVGVGLQAEPGLSLELVEALPDGEVHGHFVGAGPRHHTPEMVKFGRSQKQTWSICKDFVVKNRQATNVTSNIN